MAAVRRYDVATQLSKTASTANSLPIRGSAMLREDAIKDGRKELNVAIIKTDFLLTELFISS